MNFITRYVWAYLSWNDGKQISELSFWISPDPNAPHMDTIPTPNSYSLTRNDVRYLLQSEVKLSEISAIRIAGILYDAEFLIAPKIPMKSRRKRK
jgi:hypothetical protein